MESNKKMIIYGGLVLVLIFGMFGTYIHFTKQDIIISSEKKNENTTAKSNNNSTSKNNTQKDEEVSKDDENTASNVNSSSDNKVSNGNNTENETKDDEETGTGDNEIKISYVKYTVVKGDTLTSIWRKNIVSYPFSRAKELILSKNSMNSANELKIGAKLQIPFIDSKGYNKYIVKKGDSLTSIAKQSLPNKKVSEAIAEITKVNGSENVENIEPDQALLIPIK